MRVKEIVILSLLTTILVAQEQILAVLPNIQMTFLLIFLYTKIVGVKKTVFIIAIYVFLDCLITSSLGLITFIPMLIGWLLVPLSLGTIFKPCKSTLSLAFVSIILSITYALSFMVAAVIVSEISFEAYVIADIPFTLLLALSSFLSIWWLYDPLYRVINQLHTSAISS
ncbi:MAG: hypothetical protein WCQ80_00945 [Bacilli bacterium]